MFRFNILVYIFISIASLGALDVPLRYIQDDSSLRRGLLNTWFNETPSVVLAKKPLITTLPGGDRIQIRTETNQQEFAVVLAREYNGSYPGWAQGSWILTRQKNTGTIEQIRVFLRSDPYVYVQFRPFSTEKCVMDVVVYDAYVIYAQPLPFSMERMLVLPVEEAISIIGARFPRKYFEPEPGIYQDMRTFVLNVRKSLPELQFDSDGAIDESGLYVYIANLEPQQGDGGLNCSGFAKWLIDGILRPLTGERLSIPPLKEPFGSRGSSFTEPFEKARDPFFGLDWTRNLAATVFRTIYGTSPALSDELEVRKSPFSQITVRNNGKRAIQSYPNFLMNAGFSFEGIQPLLYTLAIDEPGYMYLASVNNDGGSPSMRTHFHVAALIPYFDERGIFQITVFESVEETSFNHFKNRYPGHFVNLVRVPIEGFFDP
ncbi:MAG: hypothetical protein LBQ77_04890 [Treponema sp.]|jgi:hypothetical protein|nr:hypothetical protein [Treponema sp.]